MLRVITVAMMTVSLCGSATRIDAYITPTQEGLFEMSEVVAIGTPVANRDGKRASLPAQPVSIPIVEVETDFEVEAVLKGKLESKLITIVHYRLVEPPPPMRLAGPEPRVFDTKPYVEYLMFLQRRPDGKFQSAVAPDTELGIRRLCEATSNQALELTASRRTTFFSLISTISSAATRASARSSSACFR